MPAPQFISYDPEQLANVNLDSRHFAAVDLDDDECVSLVRVTGSYDYDGEQPRTSTTIDVTNLGVEHLTILLNGKAVYDGDAELEGVSAADVAGVLRAAMKNSEGVGRTILYPSTIDQILTTLGL